MIINKMSDDNLSEQKVKEMTGGDSLPFPEITWPRYYVTRFYGGRHWAVNLSSPDRARPGEVVDCVKNHQEWVDYMGKWLEEYG